MCYEFRFACKASTMVFLIFVYEVALVEQDLVCESDLLLGLVFNTLRFLLQNVLEHVLGIDHSTSHLQKSRHLQKDRVIEQHNGRTSGN